MLYMSTKAKNVVRSAGKTETGLVRGSENSRSVTGRHFCTVREPKVDIFGCNLRTAVRTQIYFLVCFCFILLSCCIIVSVVG